MNMTTMAPDENGGARATKTKQMFVQRLGGGACM